MGVVGTEIELIVAGVGGVGAGIVAAETARRIGAIGQVGVLGAVVAGVTGVVGGVGARVAGEEVRIEAVATVVGIEAAAIGVGMAVEAMLERGGVAGLGCRDIGYGIFVGAAAAVLASVALTPLAILPTIVLVGGGTAGILTLLRK